MSGGLDIFAIIVLLVLLIAALVIWVILAMLPGRIAKNRNHPQAEAINVGGWLGALIGGVFWPVILVWAFTKSSQSVPPDTESQTDDFEALQTRIAVLEKKLP